MDILIFQPDNIGKILSERLAPGYSTNLDDYTMTVNKDSNFTPMGQMIHAYTVSKGTHYHANL